METLNKVAKITLLFWLTKVVATTLGETLGDFISMTLNLGYIVGITVTCAFFLVMLLIQLSFKKHIPVIYWIVIVATTTFGTEISDFIDRTLKLGYALGSLVLVACLATALFLWKRKYQTLEVYPITDRVKETYYWIAILFSNSLGTAFGDFLSDNMGLSYLHGALVTGAVIFVVVLLHYKTRLNRIVLFWIAFIFTRPFGATFGDFLTKPTATGGMNFSRLTSSLVCISIICVFQFLQWRTNRKNPNNLSFA